MKEITPEQARMRILEEEAARVKAAKQAAWAPVVPALITSSITALMVYLWTRKK